LLASRLNGYWKNNLSHWEQEMDLVEEKKNVDSRIAGEVLGALILLVAGVAFFRTKRKLVSLNSETSEEWEDCLGI
jgi:hypothetical protein